MPDLSILNSPYRGRFAPTPTGPLHMGSLVAALGSFLEARVRGGSWMLRLEDLDTERCRPGADEAIVSVLRACRMEWDEPVIRQSTRLERYEAAFQAFGRMGLVFPCGCSRREIADSSIGPPAIDGGLVYPGTCRDAMAPNRQVRSWRIRVGDAVAGFDDGVQRRGHFCQKLAESVGDFVIKRADGVFAYQLAVVVDDGEQGITHVVRGADLIDSTARQIFLQQCLRLPTPGYAHLPIIVDDQGQKLSKQTMAPAIREDEALHALIAAAGYLDHRPPPAACATLGDYWRWMLENWRLDRVPDERSRLFQNF